VTHPPDIVEKWFPGEDLSRYDPAKFFFDAPAAQKAVNFFSLLHQVEGEWAGQPFKLQGWEQRIVRDIFGWKRVEDRLRKHRTAYVEIPKKNGKSTVAAGVGLLLTTADGEPSAKVYSAAADRDQAAIVYDYAAQMVKASPALAKRCQVYKRNIYVPETASLYKVLSADVRTKHGLNVHGCIFDELHTQPNRHLWDTLTFGTASRRQPLVFAITTAGFDEESICYEIHDYALKVLEGIIPDDTFYTVIFAADEKDDWTKEETWKKANPNFGITVKPDYIRVAAARAEKVPAEQNVFKRLHLNIWTQQSVLWMDMNEWKACGEPFDLKMLDGETCYGGLDLSMRQDLSAFALLFPREEGDPPALHYYSLMRFWIPEQNLAEKVRVDRVPYDVWSRQGFAFPTPGNIIDYDRIRSQINADGERFNIREIAFDRYNATQLSTQLEGDGFTMVPFGQGFVSMSGPTNELMTLVLSRRLHHGGNPILTWNARNVSVKQDAAGNLKPDKAATKNVEAARRKRIDGIVAAIMALGRATVGGPGGPPGVFVL
jgi:phage terminase large subunit-like protein